MRKQFETNLHIYLKTRSLLQGESQALRNLGQVLLNVNKEAKDAIASIIKKKFDNFAQMIISTGKAMNALTQWSVTEKPEKVGLL